MGTVWKARTAEVIGYKKQFLMLILKQVSGNSISWCKGLETTGHFSIPKGKSWQGCALGILFCNIWTLQPIFSSIKIFVWICMHRSVKDGLLLLVWAGGKKNLSFVLWVSLINNQVVINLHSYHVKGWHDNWRFCTQHDLLAMTSWSLNRGVSLSQPVSGLFPCREIRLPFLFDLLEFFFPICNQDL